MSENIETNKPSNVRITFDEMPGIMQNILETLDACSERIGIIEQKIKNPCKWIDVDKLVAYLPTPPTKRTVYYWIRTKQIPYYRRQKSVFFLTSEIDEWLKSNPSVVEEIETPSAEEYIKNHPLKKK